MPVDYFLFAFLGIEPPAITFLDKQNQKRPFILSDLQDHLRFTRLHQLVCLVIRFDKRSRPSLSATGSPLSRMDFASEPRISRIPFISFFLAASMSALTPLPRLPPDCSPAKRTGTTVDFSSSRKGIDYSAGAAI
jgi:hypothetical protein